MSYGFLEIVDTLGLQSASFLALSLGGIYVLKLASKIPERFDMLVLLDAGALIASQRMGLLSMLGAIIRCNLFPNECIYHKASLTL